MRSQNISPASLPPSTRESPKPRTNVIILITDDQGYGDLGCHGNPVAQTPHLDALHSQSQRLTDFHVAPMCTPTRGQLLSGLDAARNGAVNVSSGRALLRPELTTMADRFRASGYRTGLFGKWHLGDNYPFRPQDRGFEESLWFPSSHISSAPDYWENDYFDDVYCRNGSRQRYSGYCTEVFFNEAMKWMAAQIESEAPFFAYLPSNAPHAPLWAPEPDRLAIEEVFAQNENCFPSLETVDRARIIRFLAMIRNVDTQVGRLRSFLQSRSVAEDTLFLFLTDNGSTFGPLYYNAGMRGAKRSLWEGGHRVPAFVHWPNGNLGAPRDVGGLTQVQDLLPTLVDFCGLEPEATPLDGISLAPVLRAKEDVPGERALIVNYSRQPQGNTPIPDGAAKMRREGSAVLWKRWRLLEASALYNLESDPGQEQDVSADHPEIVRHLTKILDAWWQGVEPIANQVQRVVIGNARENPTLLSACEWRDIFLDQQHQVRVGEQKNSHWDLMVEQAGRYEFALRRWPRESGLSLTEACGETVVTDGHMVEGKALPIAQARIQLNHRQLRRPVSPGVQSVRFTTALSAGPLRLQTWFDDAKQESLCGAYYVEVKRLPDRRKAHVL